MDTETRTMVLGKNDIERFTINNAFLEVVTGTQSGKTALIDKRIFTIGSSPECDFFIDDVTVSHKHCLIELHRDGYLLRDTGSKNHTLVNNIIIKEAFIYSGATIVLGNSSLVFRQGKKTVNISISKRSEFGDLKGKSLGMREIFAILDKISKKDVTVLIEGESGTGKEVIAKEIHRASNRRDKPFIVFDCSAVPPDLIESELFGHVKGAFTSAVSNRKGAFLEADGGTLFLDEIGELSKQLQPKLLRILESREVKPIGSNRVTKVNVRIIAATNRKLKDEIKQENFREDLFYRLAVIKIFVPPLRERTEDIPLLVDLFEKQACKQYNKPNLKISYETMLKLQNYPWKGNVRELKNAVERAVLLAEEDEENSSFFLSDTLLPLSKKDDIIENKLENSDVLSFSVNIDQPFKNVKSKLLEQFEKTYWLRILTKCNGSITRSAQISGMHRKSVEYLMKKYNLRDKNLNKREKND